MWDDFADWYIEASKAAPNIDVLCYSLETILKIVHPFAPFVTETIWQTLAWESDSILAQAPWPEHHKYPKGAANEFEHVRALVGEIRSIKHTVETIEKLQLHYKGVVSDEQISLLKQLARLSAIVEAEQGIQLLTSTVTAQYWLNIDDKTARKYLAKLDAQQLAEEQTEKRLMERLSNEQYVAHAPEALVAETRQQLVDAKSRLELIKQDKDRFAKV